MTRRRSYGRRSFELSYLQWAELRIAVQRLYLYVKHDARLDPRAALVDLVGLEFMEAALIRQAPRGWVELWDEWEKGLADDRQVETRGLRLVPPPRSGGNGGAA